MCERVSASFNWFRGTVLPSDSKLCLSWKKLLVERKDLEVLDCKGDRPV
ncbi:MAG: hypothetical protein QGH39_09295 [Candidatus Thermoplasmatota archaeon]|nr:hypothetical protein [Candidatus Thermoplasmatota archaeon]